MKAGRKLFPAAEKCSTHTHTIFLSPVRGTPWFSGRNRLRPPALVSLLMQRAADGEAREDFDACPATLNFTWACRPTDRLSSRGSSKNFQRARTRPRRNRPASETERDILYFFFLWVLLLLLPCAVSAVRVLIIALREEEFYFTHAMHSGMPSLCLRPPPRMSLNCINNALALSPAKAMQQRRFCSRVCMPTIKLFYCPV